MSSLSNLINQLLQERGQKYGQGLSALQSAAELFGPGAMAGEEMAGQAAIEQSAAGRGLSGTTMPGAMSVGMKAQLEDIRKSRLSDAFSNIANYIGQSTPSAGTIGGIASQASSLAQRQAETAPGAQWAMRVSPAAIQHQQSMMRGGAGQTSRITRWR